MCDMSLGLASTQPWHESERHVTQHFPEKLRHDLHFQVPIHRE